MSKDEQLIDGADADALVYQRIRRAILSGLLRPGMKLQEPRLAKLLGCTRERVRKALHHLAHEKWLDIIPNKGVFIPVPSVQELHAIFEARRLIELGVTRQLAERSHILDMQPFFDHVRKEREAAEENDRSTVARLAAEFHFLLVESLHNPLITDMHRGLMLRSSLHFSLYAPMNLQAGAGNGCAGPHEHEAIVQALLDGNGARVEKLMQRHLSQLEVLLSARQPKTEFLPLEEVFASIGQNVGGTATAGDEVLLGTDSCCAD
ncbi:GntR family transcriptional regulator [Lampropedia puyangensis]|uniref:GntR family transcriptional regulator n=1 Tax=Lampropedia puyangensis TaxID=1330072 RepID=A0A4S8FCD0_9BURK|nr:GntR family transcriptional regulator [Lampropedia puyangensis]THU04989.1 GntR family transcriptional regulator [Lampropedia puyangensis]